MHGARSAPQQWLDVMGGKMQLGGIFIGGQLLGESDNAPQDQKYWDVTICPHGREYVGIGMESKADSKQTATSMFFCRLQDRCEMTSVFRASQNSKYCNAEVYSLRITANHA